MIEKHHLNYKNDYESKKEICDILNKIKEIDNLKKSKEHAEAEEIEVYH